MYNPKSGKWTLLRDYSSSNTYTLGMTGSGNKIIYVDVMDALGDVKEHQQQLHLLDKRNFLSQPARMNQIIKLYSQPMQQEVHLTIHINLLYITKQQEHGE